MTSRAVLLCLVVAFGFAPTAHATKLCGDNVAGLDLPCACGDTVVSDVVLDDDPVTTEICTGNGLVVRAAEASRGVTVDLHGHTLRGGRQGTGVLVLHGGPGGARLISTGGQAALEGFLDGISVHGTSSLALLENIQVVNSHRDGIRIDTDGYELRNAASDNAGRHGFSLSGRRFRVSGTRSVGAGKSGYFVAGQDGILGVPGAGLVAEGAGDVGFNVMGMGHSLVECVARGSAKDGVMILGSVIEVRGCVASNNRADGIGGMGTTLRLSDNRAADNTRHGIVVNGMGAQDQGGNQGTGNRGDGAHGGAVQCEIEWKPCAS